MFGVNGSIGILGRSVEFLLNKKRINATVIEMTENDLFDLGNGNKETLHNTGSLISIGSMAEFDELVSKVLKVRSQKKTNQNNTSSRSHLIFKLSFEDNTRGQIAFIDLAGWENPDQKNINETKFINSSLTSLNTLMANIAQKKVVTFDSKLTKLLKPYFTAQKKCICILMYHVSNTGIKKGLENIKNVIPSAQIKTMTLKRKPLEPIENLLK